MLSIQQQKIQLKLKRKKCVNIFWWWAIISPLLFQWVHHAHEPVQLQWFGGKCVYGAAVFTNARACFTHTATHPLCLQKRHEAQSVFSLKHKRLHFDLRDKLLISHPWKSLWRDKRFPLARTGNFNAWKQPSAQHCAKHAWLTCAARWTENCLPLSVINVKRFHAHSSAFYVIFTFGVLVFGSAEYEDLRAFNTVGLH